MIVYKVTFPNNKCYIGITSKSLSSRKKTHYKMRNSRNYKFYNALNKYKDLEKWEILDSSANNWEELCELEKFYINKYNSCYNGYNSTSGGDGNYNPCEEVRNKMSMWQKGKKLSKKHKLALSKAKLGKKYGPRDNTYVTRNEFKVIDKNTEELLGIFTNASECARALNTYPACISRCLKHPHKYKSYKNFLIKPVKQGEVYHS